MTMTTAEALAVLLQDYALLCPEGMDYADPETLHQPTGEVCRLSSLRRRVVIKHPNVRQPSWQILPPLKT